MAIKTTYALLYDTLQRSLGRIDVQDEKEAFAQAVKNRDIFYFELYEQETVTVGGKEFKTDPVPLSGRNFIDVRLHDYSKHKPSPQEDALVRQFSRAIPGFADILKQAEVHERRNPTPPFVTARDDIRGEDKMTLKPGDKVFDRQGQQVWPDSPPGPSATPGPAP